MILCVRSKTPEIEAGEMGSSLAATVKFYTLFDGKVEFSRIRHVQAHLVRETPNWDQVETLAQGMQKSGWLPTLGSFTLIELLDAVHGDLRPAGTGFFGQGSRGHLAYHGVENLVGTVDGMHRSLALLLAIWMGYNPLELTPTMLVGALVFRHDTPLAVQHAYGMVSERALSTECALAHVHMHKNTSTLYTQTGRQRGPAGGLGFVLLAGVQLSAQTAQLAGSRKDKPQRTKENHHRSGDPQQPGPERENNARSWHTLRDRDVGNVITHTQTHTHKHACSRAHTLTQLR